MKDKDSTRAVASLEASPHPVPYGIGLGLTTVTWNVGDGPGGQVYVSANGGPGKLFAEGSEGAEDASWISTGVTYKFSLYAGRDHASLLFKVIVTRDAIPREAISEELIRYASREKHLDDVARVLTQIVWRYVAPGVYQKYFGFWSEQYLLHAYLTFNSEYEVLLCNSYILHQYREVIQATFPNSPWWGASPESPPAGFWMRRKLE